MLIFLFVKVIQAGESVTTRNLCVPRQPVCGSFAHLTETEEVETNSNCCPMDEVPSTNMEFQGDQVIPAGQGVTVHDIRYGQPLSEMLTPVESVATDAGCHQINEAPALSVADPQSVSEVSVPLHENESSVRNESSTTSFDFDLLTRVVNLPSKWRWDTVDHSCYTTIMTGKEFVHKIVLITSTLLTFFMNGREFIFPFLKNRMWAHIDLQRSLVEFDTLHPCSGMLEHTLHSYRNVKSPLLTEVPCNRDEKQCTNCRIDEGKIKYIKMTQAETMASLTKRLKANQRRIQRFIVYGKNAGLTVQHLCRSIESLSANQLTEKVKHLPHQQQAVIRTFFAQGKALQRDKYGKGMRYEAVYLLEALMLKMKSNAAFKHLRNNKILPLPSPSTIRKLISSSNCHFGFNESALENIEGALKDFGKDDPARYGV
ncbi:hypothetical protein OUZ56_016653 [Daphnia magna]|uniref:Uncharacterized protein n=1 Tax=Daphnia magna TaxID=35525 RepID=A0ABR0AR96_9CRUS|nr:hypothetical protein OUZ56_016653 [Daphnia magna]